jgi:hypothetical protein
MRLAGGAAVGAAFGHAIPMLAHADAAGEDRGGAAGGGHSSGIPALRKPSIIRSQDSSTRGSVCGPVI